MELASGIINQLQTIDLAFRQISLWGPRERARVGSGLDNGVQSTESSLGSTADEENGYGAVGGRLPGDAVRLANGDLLAIGRGEDGVAINELGGLQNGTR